MRAALGCDRCDRGELRTNSDLLRLRRRPPGRAWSHTVISFPLDGTPLSPLAGGELKPRENWIEVARPRSFLVCCCAGLTRPGAAGKCHCSFSRRQAMLTAACFAHVLLAKSDRRPSGVT